MSRITAKYHSQYQLCFLMAALVNGRMAEDNGYTDHISFVMDQGNPYVEQVRRVLVR
jgi:hypothetical protein